MKKNEEKTMFKNRIKNIKKKIHLPLNNIENNTEINKILNENAAKNKTIFRNMPKRSHNSLKLNKTYNAKTHLSFGQNVSNKKKIEEELSKFTIENRKLFRNCLNKYNFQMEVYIPQKLANKEYSDKNFLLNKLILIEKMNNNIKEKIGPIEKETKLFNKQYKVIKDQNKDHQKSYMNKVEQIYQTNGFKKENIEYKENENIFTPSFFLDQKFGKTQQKDISKYSTQNSEFNTDQKILLKFENIISRKYGEKLSDENKTNENWNDNYEKDEEIKKEIMEEQRIKKMNKKQYYQYSKQLKKDIDLIKKRLKDFNLVDTNFNFKSTPNETKIDINRTNYTNSNINNNYLEINNKTKDKNKTLSSKKILKNKNDEKNIFLSARGLDLETDFNKFLPSINSIVATKRNLNNIRNINNTEPNVKKRKKIVKFKKEKSIKQDKIKNLYNILNNKNGIYEYPKEEIEEYFKNYSHRVLPNINPNLGSNIHGIFGDFQNQVKENSFDNLAKVNEYMKIDMDHHYAPNKKKSLARKVEKLDENIENLHYNILDKMLANNRKELLHH